MRHLPASAAALVLLIFCGSVGVAAASGPLPGKHWVFFTDKADAGKASEGVAVSTRTLQRRALRARRAAAWDDLPVSRAYVTAVLAYGAELIHESRWFNAISIRASDEALADISNLPYVVEVRPVGSAAARSPRPEVRAESSSKNMDHDYGLSRQQLSFVNAIDPIESSINGQGVRLGFLDTLFDFSHPALEHVVQDGRLIEVRDFTELNQQLYGSNQSNYHGLNVASIALGFHSGSLIGPAHGAEVLAATTEFAPNETNLEEDNFVAGLEWMESQGVDVVNVSLGYSTFDAGENDYSPADMDGATGITTRAADRAASLGVVMVVSAGNMGSDFSWQIITTPADGDSVIAVGAATMDSTRASFSSIGPTADGRIKPDVAALGASTLVAIRGGGYGLGSGTSFASPMVAGIVCQMLQVNPALNPAEVLDILRFTSNRANNPDNQLGWGIVNARAAVDMARGSTQVGDPPSDVTFTTAYPNPFTDSFTVEVTRAAGAAQASLRLYDALGRELDLIFDGQLAPGTNQFTYRPQKLASGVYFFVLNMDGLLSSGSLVRLR